MLTLYIGNKNYSSWSMRPWILLREAGIAFEEVRIRFDSFDSDSSFKQTIRALNPTGTVPVLTSDGFPIWDSLAIAEYLADTFPDKELWPADARQRARARSVCAEMHAGFTALRSACPMNIEASLGEVGALICRDRPAVRADLARLDTMWSELLSAHGGPMLFGGFSVADAYFAPVCMRIRTYELPLSRGALEYVDRVSQLRSVRDWIADALEERDFLAFEEPYRMHP
jgi:glutathione S-transferase